MKKFKLISPGLLEFLQEKDGGKSSRRLIFIYGSLLCVPFSYYFAYNNPDSFDIIHSSNLWFLASLGGLTTASGIVKEMKKGVKK